MKIGIYGGSFNPVHYGHVNLAKNAVAELSLDRLVVVPANVSPFKTESAKDAKPLPWDRLEMVRNAFAEIPEAVVDDREIRRGGVSYAIDTVREIASENPGAELVFLVGEDSVEGLPRWKDYEELKKLCRFESFPRTAESSTEVRRRVAAGEPIDDLVPWTVAKFIEKGIVYNPEAKVVDVVLKGLVRKEGFCPCRLPKLPEFYCPCDEFKGQMADPDYHGLCHCRLYMKP